MEPPPPHIDAHSIKAALELHLKFLLVAGYEIVSVSADSAVISNGDLAIHLDIDPRSNLVDADLVRCSTGTRYSMYEALVACGLPEDERTVFSAADAVTFERGIRRLDDQCRQHLHEGLRGNDAAFTQMAAKVDVRRHPYTMKCAYGATLNRASEAWEQKNWQLALELYQLAKPALSTTEIRRLEYLVSRDSDHSA